MKKLFILTLTFSLTALSNGCSNEVGSEEVKKIQTKEVWSLGNSIISELTTPLSYDVNSVHSYDENKKLGVDSITEFRRSGFIESYIEQCKSKFSLDKDDIGYEGKPLGMGNYYLKELKAEMVKPFEQCIMERFSSEAIDDLSLRIFLTEPNLKKFKSNSELKKHIDEIKADNKITLKEVVDTYSILEKLSNDKFRKETETLLKVM